MPFRRYSGAAGGSGFTPHGLYPQQRVSGSAVPAACRRRRERPSRDGGYSPWHGVALPPPGGGGMPPSGGGDKRGQETMFGVLSPFVPAGEHRHPRPPKAATVHALRGRKVASTGCAAASAKGLPSADGKKKGPLSRWGTICKMFTFEPLTQDEKTAYII